jgi:hypothetical protein
VNAVGAGIISWSITLGGIGILLAAPLLAGWIARRRAPRRIWLVTGAAFGLVVVPLGFWLYAQFFTDPLRALVFGFPGLFVLMTHVELVSGVRVSADMVASTDSGVFAGLASVYLPCTAVWVAVYGGLGWLRDRVVIRRQQAVPRA